MSDFENYWTTPELAQYYRTSESTIRYWRMIGYGPQSVKAGRRVLYSEQEIKRFDTKMRRAA